MASLSQILAAHGSLLVLDASGIVQAAWAPGAGLPVDHRRAEGDAGAALFRAVQGVCAQPDAAAAFAYCEAPGSVLGIRTAATAIRCWNALRRRPVYSFNALRLAAAGNGRRAAFVADARRGFWHFCIDGQPATSLPTAELAAARGPLPLVTLEGYRRWQPLPPETEVLPYDLGRLLAATADLDLFRLSESPDAALTAPTAYVQWTPRIHQNPS